MTTLSTNLGLTLYNNTTDQSGSFLSWTRSISGSSNSNMTKIDDFAGVVSGCIINLNAAISASVVIASGSVTALSGSIATLTTQVNLLNEKMQKLNEFIGAGQADFNNIPQNHKHLLIMGVVATTYSGISNVVADFNGDANAGNYTSVQWAKGDVLEYITQRITGGIVIGNANTRTNYGSTLLAIIPNYSASAGFYKTGMGMAATIETPYGVGLTGGTWLYKNPITRLRISVSFSGTRYNFIAGTVISVYGFG